MRRGNFSIQGEGGGSAEVSVIRLPANAGDLQSNITRWGRQVGISQENLSKNQPPVQQLEVGGSKATYVVLRGPERSTCVAIVRQGEGTWFLSSPERIASSKPIGLLSKASCRLLSSNLRATTSR